MHLPGSSSAFLGLPHHTSGSTSRFIPRTRFSVGLFTRLQLFRYVQASHFARLPDRSYRSKFPCRAAEASYIRAERASLPSPVSDMLSAQLQAIGGTRTLTSQDSQPCRLLTYGLGFPFRPSRTPFRVLGGSRLGVSAMDSGICQTSTASPVEPGGLPTD